MDLRYKKATKEPASRMPVPSVHDKVPVDKHLASNSSQSDISDDVYYRPIRVLDCEDLMENSSDSD